MDNAAAHSWAWTGQRERSGCTHETTHLASHDETRRRHFPFHSSFAEHVAFASLSEGIKDWQPTRARSQQARQTRQDPDDRGNAERYKYSWEGRRAGSKLERNGQVRRRSLVGYARSRQHRPCWYTGGDVPPHSLQLAFRLGASLIRSSLRSCRFCCLFKAFPPDPCSPRHINNLPSPSPRPRPFSLVTHFPTMPFPGNRVVNNVERAVTSETS